MRSILRDLSRGDTSPAARGVARPVGCFGSGGTYQTPINTDGGQLARLLGL